ncbi:MAG: HAD family phosphatase [Acidobacteria bacterium]|nr:HAD family phosphatase [Acidobacteriota bacterium]
MAQPYDAILFDFDGVLIDSEPVHFRCWREVMTPFGVSLDWETYDATLRGHSGEVLLDLLCGLRDPPLDRESVSAIYPVKNDLFHEVFANTGEIVAEETRALLGDLRGYKLGVVSSARGRHVYPNLERAGVLGYFQTIVCREDVTMLKPDPEPYRTAGARLGARAALVVEDSEAGAASGSAAGWDVLLVPNCAAMPGLLRERLGRPIGTYESRR